MPQREIIQAKNMGAVYDEEIIIIYEISKPLPIFWGQIYDTKV